MVSQEQFEAAYVIVFREKAKSDMIWLGFSTYSQGIFVNDIIFLVEKTLKQSGFDCDSKMLYDLLYKLSRNKKSVCKPADGRGYYTCDKNKITDWLMVQVGLIEERMRQ